MLEAMLLTLGRAVFLLEGLFASSKADLLPANIDHIISGLMELFILFISSVDASGEAPQLSFWDMTSAGTHSRGITRNILRILRARNSSVVERTFASLKAEAKSIGKISIGKSLLYSNIVQQQLRLSTSAISLASRYVTTLLIL